MNIDNLIRAIVYLTRDNPEHRELIESFLLERESHGFRQINWIPLYALDEVVYDACSKLIQEAEILNPEYFKTQEYARLLDSLNIPYTTKKPPEILRFVGYGRGADMVHYYNPLSWSSGNLIYSRDWLFVMGLITSIFIILNLSDDIELILMACAALPPVVLTIVLINMFCFRPKKIPLKDYELEGARMTSGSPRLIATLELFVQMDKGIYLRDLQHILQNINSDKNSIEDCINELSIVPGNAKEIEALEDLQDVYMVDQILVTDLIQKAKSY